MARQKVILLVEDNPDDVELTLNALRENNISNKVEVVCDGQQALDFIYAKGAYAGREKELLPAVVLLDIKLPKIDGLEVLRKIRENTATKLLPVVILTSSREEKDLVNGYKFGCNSYVRKPVEFEQFVKAVKELGLYWLLLNEPPVVV